MNFFKKGLLEKSIFTLLISIALFIILIMVAGCTSDDSKSDIVLDADKDGYTVTAGDCNDNDITIYPGAPEVCGDGIDQDCNGADLPCDTSDADGDGYTVTAGDCNDNDATINPGATETGCDGIDQDCNGSDYTVCTYYKDNDSDRYGNPNIYLTTTLTPTGDYVLNNNDCNDSDATFNPGETELCDGKDNNCNGTVDEGCAQVTYYKDGDNDTYVIFTDSVTQAPPPPATYIADPHYGVADCDDTDVTIYPGAPEVTDDGIDQNCDGYDSTTGCTTCHTQTEFATTGHGLASGTYASTNPAANSTSTFATCTSYCHTDTVGHSTTTNPYRLITAGLVVDFTDLIDPRSASENAVCLDCHASNGPNSSLASVYIGTVTDTNRHYLTAHTTTGQTAGGNFCVDCHDPHGDTNDYMIHDSVTKRSDGQYSTPVTQITVTFPDTSGTYDWDAYVNPSPFDGLCQVCHETTSRFTKGFSSVNGDYDTTHNSSTRCTSCHGHSSGFQGVGGGGAGTDCTACHNTGGVANTGTGGSAGNRRSIQVDFEKTYQHGSNWAGLNPLDCELCHFLDNHAGTTVQLKEWTSTSAWSSVDYDSTDLPAMNVVCLSCHTSASTGQNLQAGGTPPDINTRWTNTTVTNPDNDYNKYDPATYNTVPILAKSYTPHADPATNQAKSDMDISTTLSADHQTNVVACLDCHPAHGSSLGSGGIPGLNIVAKNGAGGYSRYNKTRVMLREDDRNSGSYTAEEHLCWGCHDKTLDYYGDNDSGSDTPAVVDSVEWQNNWSNSIAVYKAGSFESSHFYPSKSVTWSGAGVPSGTRADIYCSTCHNPHGVIAADEETTGDLSYMLPILRGPWLTSPYKEDRAPGSVTTNAYNSANNEFGPYPRVVSDKYQSDIAPGSGYSGSWVSGMDGYIIDQNTFGTGVYIAESQNDFAGLCMSTNGDYGSGCHVKTTLLSLPSWTGHNVVAGWDTDGSAVFTDVFMGAAGTRTGQGDLMSQTGGSEWMMQYFGGKTVNYNWTDADYKAFGTRNTDEGGGPAPDGPPRVPQIDVRWAYTGGNKNDPAINTWGIDYTKQNDSGGAPAPYVQEAYHQFPCSKCHTPHASRLQRLMRTNCLDNGQAGDYDNAYANQSGGVTGSHTPSGTIFDNIAATSINNGPNLMNFEAANCHSVAGSTSGGWNTITPW